MFFNQTKDDCLCLSDKHLKRKREDIRKELKKKHWMNALYALIGIAVVYFAAGFTKDPMLLGALTGLMIGGVLILAALIILMLALTPNMYRLKLFNDELKKRNALPPVLESP